MGLRDIVLTAVVLGCIPFILRRPWFGALVWTWVSLMNPHRLTWGFAYDMPFAQIVGIAFLLGLLFSKEEKRIPWSPLTRVWLLFVLWMCVTTVFALNPSGVMIGWEKSMKIQIVSFLILMVINTPERLKLFVWCVALSIGFFGVKGGIFTISTGGAQRVYGPGGFIGGNNEIAFALIIIFPLMRFLQMQAQSIWVKHGFTAAMVLCAASVIGSQSRGAFLAVMAMGLFLIWKSRRRIPLLLASALLVPLAVSFAPQKYWDRMESIRNYEQDGSAMGRINAWGFAVNLVRDHPLTGGGFETFTPALFKRYAPVPDDHHDVHSIYFEVLGEQGLVGFVLYMALMFLAWRYAGWTASRARGDPSLLWQHDLARMTQVCLVGYATGGAFLGLAYFDLYYDIIIIIVMNRLILERRLAAKAEEGATGDARAGKPSPRLAFSRLAPRGPR